jgi:hypothetical protein
MHRMASEMSMRQHPWIRQRSIWKVAFMAAAAGCDAGTTCAGCQIPEFTVSDGDAAPQASLAQVAVEPRPQQAVDMSIEAGSDFASYFANGHSSGSVSVGASDASSDPSPGYTVVRRVYPATTSPAVSEGPQNRDAAATSSVGGSGEDAAPDESPVAAAVPPEPGLNAIVVPVVGAPATPPPANNVAPMSPRSITYPMPPVPGR